MDRTELTKFARRVNSGLSFGNAEGRQKLCLCWLVPRTPARRASNPILGSRNLWANRQRRDYPRRRYFVDRVIYRIRNIDVPAPVDCDAFRLKKARRTSRHSRYRLSRCHFPNRVVERICDVEIPATIHRNAAGRSEPRSIPASRAPPQRWRARGSEADWFLKASWFALGFRPVV